jgi:hypothetical protein
MAFSSGDPTMQRARKRSLAVIGILAAGTLFAVRMADAHDFWLRVRGQTSSRFPTSESAVTPDRVTAAQLISAAGVERISALSTSGPSLVLRHRPSGHGQRIVAVTVGWRSVRAAGRDLKRYIELEGNPALAARYEREGLLPTTDSITRRYAKYAKTFVQVGSGGARVFDRIAGHPLEFVALNDPNALRAGDTLAVRLLYEGQPLAAAHVHAGVAADGDGPQDLSLDTDADGVIRVPLSHPGLWNVRMIHVVPAPRTSGADWESHFATLVFGVTAASRP